MRMLRLSKLSERKVCWTVSARQAARSWMASLSWRPGSPRSSPAPEVWERCVLLTPRTLRPETESFMVWGSGGSTSAGVETRPSGSGHPWPSHRTTPTSWWTTSMWSWQKCINDVSKIAFIFIFTSSDTVILIFWGYIYYQIRRYKFQEYVPMLLNSKMT